MPCSCNTTPCSCSPCQPANVVYQASCTDPGSVTALRHLLGLDANFCSRRLLPGVGGFLVARQTGSGTWVYAFTNAPVVDLETYQAIAGQVIPNLVVQGSDNILRELLGPAVANRILLTNAAGQLIFAPIPTATVPDPLTVTDLTVNNVATLNDVTVAGGVNFSGLGTGTLSFFLGVDAGGNLIQGTPATTGVQSCMFYEWPVSPAGANFPNAAVTANNLLTIGNLLYDSVLPVVPGGALITAINSQTLSVLTAGNYVLDWCGQVEGSNGSPSINLLINGVNVNSANGTIQGTVLTTGRSANLAGFETRRLAVGTTIQLQLGAQSGASIATYEVRLRAQRIGA